MSGASPCGPQPLRQRWCFTPLDPAVEECTEEYRARSFSYATEGPAEVDTAWQSMTAEQSAFSEGLCAWQNQLFDQLEIHMKMFKDVSTEVQAEISKLNDMHARREQPKKYVRISALEEQDPGYPSARPSEAVDPAKGSSECGLETQKSCSTWNTGRLSSDSDSLRFTTTSVRTTNVVLDRVPESTERRGDTDALMVVKGWKKASTLKGCEFKEGGSKHTIARWMGFFSTGLILTNTIFTGVKVHINLERAQDGHQESEWLTHVDSGLTLAFCVELVLRVALFQRDFFAAEWRAWNVFDVILTVSGALEWTLSFWDLNFLRSLRIFRAVRVVRVLRGLRLVHELRLMVASVIVSLGSLVWACVFLVFILYLFAIIISMDVAVHVLDNDSVDTALTERYGTLSSCMLSLFKCISGGADWGVLMEPLLEINAYFYTVFFVFYIFFTVFGVMNVLTAIFCDAATRVSQIDRDLVIQDQVAQSDSCANELKNLFNETCSPDHLLSKQDLETHLDCTEVQHYLKFLELDVHEARGLFQLLDVDENGKVSVDEFVIGMMRLKGVAKGVDVATLMYENKKLYVRVVALAKFTEERFQNLERVVRGEDRRHISNGSLADHVQDEEEIQRSLKMHDLSRARQIAKRMKLFDNEESNRTSCASLPFEGLRHLSRS